MKSANAPVGNIKDNNDEFCFAKPGELYLGYLPDGGSSDLDLSGDKGSFALQSFNPREGGQKSTLTAPAFSVDPNLVAQVSPPRLSWLNNQLT